MNVFVDGVVVTEISLSGFSWLFNQIVSEVWLAR
jgi:hypothetical protein